MGENRHRAVAPRVGKKRSHMKRPRKWECIMLLPNNVTRYHVLKERKTCWVRSLLLTRLVSCELGGIGWVHRRTINWVWDLILLSRNSIEISHYPHCAIMGDVRQPESYLQLPYKAKSMLNSWTNLILREGLISVMETPNISSSSFLWYFIRFLVLVCLILCSLETCFTLEESDVKSHLGLEYSHTVQVKSLLPATTCSPSTEGWSHNSYIHTANKKFNRHR